MYNAKKQTSQSQAIPTPTLYPQSIKIDQTDEPLNPIRSEKNKTIIGKKE